MEICHFKHQRQAKGVGMPFNDVQMEVRMLLEKHFLGSKWQIGAGEWEKLRLVSILLEMTDDWLQHAAKAETWINNFLCGHLSPAQFLYDI